MYPCVYLQDLTKGILIARINRFVARVRISDGEEVLAHCPNSGSMLTCSEPGRTVWLSEAKPGPRRRLKYTWELIEMPTSMVGINTNLPNRLVYQGIRMGYFKQLAGYGQIRREAKVGADTRLDFCLEHGGRRFYLEVKNCTMAEEGIGYFPDAKTIRGQRHLKVLMELKRKGEGAGILFVVQRSDVRAFKPHDQIDPLYGRYLRDAKELGVEIMAYRAEVRLDSICLSEELTVIL